MIVLAYWLVLIGLSAFFLRQACGLCRTFIPGWRRSVVSTLLIGFLAYLTYDFSAYLLMRSLDDVVIQVPPWYSYPLWFHEAPAFKWYVISQAGPLCYLPIVFALCAAGTLQVIVLQAEIGFRWGVVIVLLQWGATAVAGYVLALLVGVAARAAPEQFAAAQQSPAAALRLVPPDVKEEAWAKADYAALAWKNAKAYADSHLAALDEDLAPFTRHLPEPVQRFLAQGGWWVVLGVLGCIALLQVATMLRRLLRAVTRPRRRKRGRKKKVLVNLREDLEFIGDAYTDPGPQRLTIRGVPARLRLVVLSAGSSAGGALTEEMADRVLDWIKPGLAKVSANDFPKVRVWPMFPSGDGFGLAFAKNARIPERPGEKSRWVLVSGRVKMGPALLHVGLALYADEANSLRHVQVEKEHWLGVLGLAEPAGAR